MSKSTDTTQSDNDPGFYAPPQGTNDSRALGYADPVLAPRFLMRVTPGEVNLVKGAPVDFTIHIKALADFGKEQPLTLTLEPVIGRGSCNFAEPNHSVVEGNPTITLHDGRITITAKSTDNAAKVILHTDYPP